MLKQRRQIDRFRVELELAGLDLGEFDFADCSALAGVLSGQDAAVFCLGVYTGAVSDAELRKVTVDYTVEFTNHEV